MKAFEDVALQRFEDKMVAHSKAFTPRLCKALGDEQLRVALRQAMKRAGNYGFTYQGPVRLYIELILLFGSHFDSDPQYATVAKVLQASDDQMVRAEKIYQGILDYQKKVSGPKAIHVRKALEQLSVFAPESVTLTAGSFEAKIMQEMNRIFPQKAEHIGQKALIKLIHEGRAVAKEYKFPPLRAEGLIIVLMFAFGHGCIDDPLYPWIKRTLNDDKIVSPAAKAERLEKKSLTWLNQILSKPREKENT